MTVPGIGSYNSWIEMATMCFFLLVFLELFRLNSSIAANACVRNAIFFFLSFSFSHFLIFFFTKKTS